MNKYKSAANKVLNKWKHDNNIKEKCVIHHRNDTEECIAYNKEHYELWGHNLDGTFEYGKYVVFMTRAEHCAYHLAGRTVTDETKHKISESQKGLQAGENHPNYGKHRSNETKRKISIANSGSNNGMYGTHHSKEHNNHVSKLVKLWKANISAEYRKHKESGGTLSWNEFQSFYKNKGRDA